jgi:CheY-like chemotaxis protein
MAKPLALVVEDERDISILFSKALKAAGFETHVVYSGDEAMEWLASGTPDIIILDLNLPQMLGPEILHHIRGSERLAQMPVIVVTAYARLAEDVRDTADQVLFKPVSFAQLRDLAGRLTSQRSARQ